jgi:hypothetical protein
MWRNVINPVLVVKIKVMKEIIEIAIHDFLTDPLYYITITLSTILVFILVGMGITSLIQSVGVNENEYHLKIASLR